MNEYLRFFRLIRKELYGAMFGVTMSLIATISSIALMGTATWFLSAMAIAGFYGVALNIFIPSALIRLLAVLRTILRYCERYYTHDATFKILAYLRVFFFEKALDLRYEEALKLKSSDVQRRMYADLDRIELIYIRQFVPFVCATLVGIILGGILASFSLLLAFCVLALMFFAGVAVPVIVTRIAKDAATEQSVLGVKMNDMMSELIHGYFDIVLLGQHLKRAAAFLKEGQKLARARAKVVFYDLVAQDILMICAQLTLLMVLVLCVPLVVDDIMSPSQMMMFGVVAMASYEVLIPLSAAFLSLPNVIHSAQRVSSLLKITNDNADINPRSLEVLKEEYEADNDRRTSSAASIIAAVDIEQAKNSIKNHGVAAFAAGKSSAADAGMIHKSDNENKCLQNANNSLHTLNLNQVCFSYEIEDGVDENGDVIKTELPIFKDFSFSFSNDKNYIIKAPSGRGKSTLVMMLTSLLYPQKGDISLDGVSYTKRKSAEVRSYFAVALQDITLFSGSIFDTFKQVNPKITKEEVMWALDIVELTELIMQMPKGLDEWLGSTGLTISGGQARRLCVARALIEKDAPFLILDEPGEGLDEDQEIRIIERIQNLRKGVIMITHKNAGLNLCDEVINL